MTHPGPREMEMMDCPFCGEEPRPMPTMTNRIWFKRNDVPDICAYQVTCTFCNTRGPAKHDEDAALAAWNKRVPR